MDDSVFVWQDNAHVTRSTKRVIHVLSYISFALLSFGMLSLFPSRVRSVRCVRICVFASAHLHLYFIFAYLATLLNCGFGLPFSGAVASSCVQRLGGITARANVGINVPLDGYLFTFFAQVNNCAPSPLSFFNAIIH